MCFPLQKTRAFIFIAISFDGRLGCPIFNLECFFKIGKCKIIWCAFYMYSLQFTSTWIILCCHMTICMYHLIAYSTYQSMWVSYVIMLDKELLFRNLDKSSNNISSTNIMIRIVHRSVAIGFQLKYQLSAQLFTSLAFTW